MLAIFAHPDDEAFGPGGTLAKYAKGGVEVHLLCVTRGEAGQINEKVKNDLRIKHDENKEEIKIGELREKELLNSAKILGIKKVEFLDYIDGRLCNAIYHELAKKISRKINDFKPQVVLTAENHGVSGHLDHIAVSMITTYAYLKTEITGKLYYHCLPQKLYDERMQNYFIYFPEGYKESEITTRIDYSSVWQKKVAAMKAHQSQSKDAETLIARFEKWPKIDNFILKYSRGIKVKLPEKDFFEGIKEK